MDGFFVNIPGAQTSVQDEGRFGYQWSGMCPSGAMDMHSLRIANILVGNKMNEAGLEVTLTGPDMTFMTDEVIAITGADISPMLDGTPIPMYCAISVKKGQHVHFGARKTGCRAYIAFAGGLDIEPMYDSRSTWVRINIGPIDHALRKGDMIGFRAPSASLPQMAARSIAPETIESKDIEIRVLLGPQDDLFTEEGIANFFGKDGYKVSNLCNRQGYRLEGPNVELIKKGSIVSDGIAKGAIQVPPSEQPIILLSERQSTGGYAKIGNVISVDIPKVGQAIAGSRLRFKKVSIEEAQRLLADEAAYLENLESRIKEAKPTEYRVKINQSVYHIAIQEMA